MTDYMHIPHFRINRLQISGLVTIFNPYAKSFN